MPPTSVGKIPAVKLTTLAVKSTAVDSTIATDAVNLTT